MTRRSANHLCDLKGEPGVVFQVQSQPGFDSEFQAGLQVVLVAKTKANSINTFLNFEFLKYQGTILLCVCEYTHVPLSVHQGLSSTPAIFLYFQLPGGGVSH